MIRTSPSKTLFTPTLVAGIPSQPGTYRFYDSANQLIYVGKAKNLRRRLAQYRNAKRRNAHAKMRKIVREAKRLEFEVCENEFQALAIETQWIQTHRPKWNVAGAFFFLYPLIGIRVEDEKFYVCYTTDPEAFPGFSFHGAFRSRERTKEAFFALIELLGWIGHRIPQAHLQRAGLLSRKARRGFCYGFRQVPAQFRERFPLFLRGEDFSPIQDLCLLLLDHPGAIAQSQETQAHLHAIRRFWRHEIQLLKQARDHSQWLTYPVAQRDRDPLFIALRSRAQLSSCPPLFSVARIGKPIQTEKK